LMIADDVHQVGYRIRAAVTHRCLNWAMAFTSEL
jgi:hypothetical protein